MECIYIAKLHSYDQSTFLGLFNTFYAYSCLSEVSKVVTRRCLLTTVSTASKCRCLQRRSATHALRSRDTQRPQTVRQLPVSVSKNLAPIPRMLVNHNVVELADSAKGGKNMGQASTAVLEKFQRGSRSTFVNHHQ